MRLSVQPRRTQPATWTGPVLSHSRVTPLRERRSCLCLAGVWALQANWLGYRSLQRAITEDINKKVISGIFCHWQVSLPQLPTHKALGTPTCHYFYSIQPLLIYTKCYSIIKWLMMQRKEACFYFWSNNFIINRKNPNILLKCGAHFKFKLFWVDFFHLVWHSLKIKNKRKGFTWREIKLDVYFGHLLQKSKFCQDVNKGKIRKKYSHEQILQLLLNLFSKIIFSPLSNFGKYCKSLFVVGLVIERGPM